MNKTKVIFCTYSSVYSSLFLKRLLEDTDIEIVAIVNSSRILHPSYGLIKGSFKQIMISGWRYSTYLFLVTDFFRLAQIIFGHRKQSLQSVHKLAQIHKIPILDTLDINQNESISFIQHSGASFLIAAHFNQLVKTEILNLPNLSCLNIHPSLLPYYKGVDPVFYALLEENKELGVSLQRMAESFDTGEVLLQKETSFSFFNSVFLINCQLFSDGAELVSLWLKNNKKLQPNVTGDINESAHYDSWPNSKTVHKFKRKGNYLIKISEILSLIKSNAGGHNGF